MSDALCDNRDIILVIDDEKMIEEMIEELVEDQGCSHVSFTDPAKALQHYKENSERITVMITDLTMPSISGPGLIREVLQINPGLPIILITGYGEEYIPHDILSVVHCIVPKPFTKSEILDAVRTALSKVGHEHR